MAVEAHVGGDYVNPISVQINVDTTPRDGSDSEGAISTASFNVTSNGRNHVINKRQNVTLIDGSVGKENRWTGTVRSVDDTFGNVNYLAVDKLNDLNIFVNLPPFQGTLLQAFNYYVKDHIKVTDAEMIYNTNRTDDYVVFPAVNGNLWAHIKQLCIAYQLELRSVPQPEAPLDSFPRQIIISEIGREDIAIEEYISAGVSVGVDEPAQFVRCIAYDYRWVEGEVLWPEGGWNEDAPVQSLHIGTNEFELQLESSVESLTEPMILDEVPPEYDGDRTVYTIVGEDDLPIKAAQWNDLGGKLTTTIGEDHKTINVEVFVPPGIRNAQGEDMKTFKIAMSAGSSHEYSSLRIVGTGVVTGSQELKLPTGIDENVAGSDSGQTIDNIFVDSKAKAWDLMVNAHAAVTTGPLTMPVNAPNQNIKRNGEKITPAEMPGGRWFDPYTKRYYRVRNVSTNLASTNMTLENLLTNADVQSHFLGMTYNQVQSIYQGKTYDQVYLEGINHS